VGFVGYTSKILKISTEPRLIKVLIEMAEMDKGPFILLFFCVLMDLWS
jgi:hypothetical protein